VANGVDDFAKEAEAIFEAAAVFVLALVGEGREEFIN
jgi:hypothetical protein